jgi:hypothetical protein
VPLPWSLPTLAAPAPPPAGGPSLLDPRLLWATISLVAILLLGALVLALFDRLRKRADQSVLTPGDQLAEFRLSYERGELSQQEYERIRAKLGPKLRQQLNLPPQGPERERAKPAPGEPPPAAAPDNPEIPPTGV